MPKPHYFIGLMSGTSADGVDAALIEISQNNIKLIDFLTHQLPSELKQTLIQLNSQPNIALHTLCSLQKNVADVFSLGTLELLKRNNLQASDIQAIGSHGQTIFHAPEIPMSLQIGHPAFIAKTTGITTVADFRVDDMALGGQGAPFAPAFHHRLFANGSDTFVINIGGIANMSYIPAVTSQQKVLGWDTGPGNALMDDICQNHLKLDYDPNGINAQKGRIQPALLKHLLAHPYFTLSAPKSTGRDTFHSEWVNSMLSEHSIEINHFDLLATLCEVTAISISQQIKTINLNTTEKANVWIVGGGAHNDFLVSRIQQHLPKHMVASSQNNNMNPDAIEAMMFAWLAEQRLHNKTVQLSAVTGANRDAVLGGIWHP
ncbi:anhydro-N-acetylmuramic acid kinase [Thiomicrorhabdus sp. Kp2]|uniref:anhydro-N-acetylmuramic acid kinase n=1 Tax=Thiomicrorhabdus sp. Kp2 TaxID=1123518 RepID=UPI00041BCCA1|nr:anhydro-N-acetylmuramic acid kinase [Thiomicrorhabdus sp. Kp2]